MTKEALKEKFSSLHRDFNGYIVMSDKSPIIFDSLPQWEDLHNGKNFIIEAGLFKKDLLDENNGTCIAINSYNAEFLYQEVNLKNYPHKDFMFYKAIDNKIIRIARIWEEKEDKYCQNLPTLKLSFSIFAGFKG